MLGLSQVSNANISNIDKSATKDELLNLILVDASRLLKCEKESVYRAKCIPAKTFQSPKGVFASFYNITWVFGTAGIKGNEEILVFADTEKQRDAVLAIMYLAGQKKLRRWNSSKVDLQKILGKAPGLKRGIIRSKYYLAKMRDEFLVLPKELSALKRKGWQLSDEDSLNKNSTIIYGAKPLDALARFTRLFMKKTEKQLLTVLIHSSLKNLPTVK